MAPPETERNNIDLIDLGWTGSGNFGDLGLLLVIMLKSDLLRGHESQTLVLRGPEGAEDCTQGLILACMYVLLEPCPQPVSNWGESVPRSSGGLLLAVLGGHPWGCSGNLPCARDLTHASCIQSWCSAISLDPSLIFNLAFEES